MSKETNEERKFTENIDHLLAGEKLEEIADISEDHKTALNFSRTLIESRVEPSPVFKAQLKERLLSQLAQEEAKAEQKKADKISFWEFLKNLVPQSPTWRTATVTIFVALVAVSILWRAGLFTQAPGATTPDEEMEFAAAGESAVPREAVTAPVTEAPASPPSLEMQMALPILELKTGQLDPVVYLVGEKTEIDLLFQNTGPESITITEFPPPIQILDPETGAVIRSFTKGDSRLSLTSSETVTHTLTWDQLDDNEKQVAAGVYSVQVGDIIVFGEDSDSELPQSFQPFSLLIQNP